MSKAPPAQATSWGLIVLFKSVLIQSNFNQSLSLLDASILSLQFIYLTYVW